MEFGLKHFRDCEIFNVGPFCWCHRYSSCMGSHLSYI